MKRPEGSTGRRRAKAPPPTAFAQALRWLTVRDRSEAELRTKLKRAKHLPEQIEAAVLRLRALGYLDDARFARVRAESLIARGRLGPRGAAARLAAAGLSREQVQTAVGSAMKDRDELALARAALLRKHPGAVGSDDPKLRARAVRFLLGRGFSGAVVGRALGVEVEGEQA